MPALTGGLFHAPQPGAGYRDSTPARKVPDWPQRQSAIREGTRRLSSGDGTPKWPIQGCEGGMP